jgi:hypothetical protein
MTLHIVKQTVREWNKLENYLYVHNLDTPLKFKRVLLNNANEINIITKHFMYHAGYSDTWNRVEH